MEITAEQYSELPEFARGAFAESEEGKYIPVKDAALKQTLDNLDKEKRALETKNQELTKSEQDRLNELEKAKQDARNEAIAEAAKKGNWEEQERLLREKFEDELKREKEGVRSEVAKEFTVKQATDMLSADVKLLTAELAKNESAKFALEQLIKQRASIDENGQRVYLSEDGSALSITEIKDFKDELIKSQSLELLIKGETVTNGGGLANGGGNGSGSAPTDSAANILYGNN